MQRRLIKSIDRQPSRSAVGWPGLRRRDRQSSLHGPGVLYLHQSSRETSLLQHHVAPPALNTHPRFRVDTDHCQHMRIQQTVNGTGILRLNRRLQLAQSQSGQRLPQKLKRLQQPRHIRCQRLPGFLSQCNGRQQPAPKHQSCSHRLSPTRRHPQQPRSPSLPASPGPAACATALSLPTERSPRRESGAALAPRAATRRRRKHKPPNCQQPAPAYPAEQLSG